MLPRSKRVRLTADIQTIYKQGVHSRHSLLRLYALPRGRAESRATVVVSKQVHLHATIRNRIKRRLRAQLSRLLPKLHKASDLVVVAQRPAAQADAAQLNTALEHALHKLHLL
jgi:ribonuclease P protein component